MGKPKNVGYKRSWRNLLLNKGYQLRFTLFMVGLSALLMAGLGWWVLRAAEKSTTVAMDNVLGVECKRPEMPGTAPQVEIEPVEETPAPAEEPPADEEEPPADEEELPADEAEPPADEEEPPLDDDLVDEPGDGAEPSEQHRPRVIVQIEEEPVPPPPLPTTALAKYHLCKVAQVSTIDRLYQGEWRIFYVLIASGVLLCLGLAVYGIKMTHKVAGPLHKVKLYFGKMQSGRYDTVWNLRKGDQLVNFYAHFKEAHAGLVKVETEDVEMLRDMIAAADAANIGDKSAEARAALDELREILKTKEEAIDG
jgi:hypothetical protein